MLFGHPALLLFPLHLSAMKAFSFRIRQCIFKACGAMLVMAAAPVLRAAPLNDSYQAATPLSPLLPLEGAGTNVDATTEAGEITVAPSFKTVWWSWTPAASGWVKLTVAETSLDPVTSLFKGPTASSAHRVAWNDDGPEAAGRASLIQFAATAGETWHIQVAGYGNTEGPVILKLESAPLPPVLTALSFQPVAVDVTAQSGAPVFTLDISHPAEFASGHLHLIRPDGVEEAAAPVDSRFLTAGNAAAGTYQITLPVRQNVIPGTYSLRLEVVGMDGTGTTYGERSPFPDGLTTGIPVANSGIADGLPPAVPEMTITPPVADVTVTGTTAAISVRVTDLISGILDFSCHLELRSPTGAVIGGGGYLLAGNEFSFRNRQSGNSFDGTYRVEFPIPAGTSPGIYPLALHLTDTLGNTVTYGPDSDHGELPMPAGLPAFLTVVNTGTVDTQAPVLTGITLSPTSVNVAEFQSLTLTINATDARSGVETAGWDGLSCGLQPVAGGAVTTVNCDFDRISGTPADGAYRGSTTLPFNLAAGVYRLVGITLTDALGNRVTYGMAALGQIPYPAGINPQVTIVSEPLPGPYQTWLAGYPSLTGAQALRTADPDGDGLPNLVELALGINPTLANAPGSGDPNQSHVPIYQRIGNRLHLFYDTVPGNLGTGFRRISVFPQESENLLTWDGAIQIIGGGDEGREAYINITPGRKKWIRLYVYDPAADLGG
jgi:hypothetical protein